MSYAFTKGLRRAFARHKQQNAKVERTPQRSTELFERSSATPESREELYRATVLDCFHNYYMNKPKGINND